MQHWIEAGVVVGSAKGREGGARRPLLRIMQQGEFFCNGAATPRNGIESFCRW